jgi:gliding motility-associated-like protein
MMANVNLGTGAYAGSALMMAGQEIRSLCITPNGNTYGITCPLIGGATTSIFATTPAFGLIYSVPSGYAAMLETGAAYHGAPGAGGNQNGIAANRCFLYTTDGGVLDKRSRATGVVINSIAVPGGVQENNSGVVMDSCGFVYVGSQAGVYKFDGNLVPAGFAATPGAVYCVALGNGGEVLATGNGFLASLDLSACNPTSCIFNPALNFTTVNSTCNAATGSATVTMAGGISPFTYSWSNGQNTQTAVNLIPGTYTVTVTDACSSLSATVTVGNTPGHTVNLVSQTNVTCNGGSDGSATVAPSSGAGPWTYLWSPSGAGTAMASGLSAGAHTVTVTNTSTGCAATLTVNITQPNLITATSTTVPASCNQSDGSATINPSGGSGGYSYLWSPGGQTSQTISSVPAGLYSCTVTDNTGCTQTFSVSVNNASGPTVTLQGQTNVSCNGGSNGSATVNITGGTLPYTINWSPTGGSGVTASGLSAGTYTCTVNDGTGCVQGLSVTITEPSAITGSTSSTPASCGMNNGSATVSATGGSGSLSYAWSPSGGNGSTANNLAAGNYSCTVSDVNGCSATFMVTVNNTGAPTVSQGGMNHVSCYGGNNGSATVTVSGGNPGYSYAWTPYGGTGPTASGLTAGNYTCTVTDNSGCISSTSFTINQPGQLTMSTSSTASNCAQNNGTATVNASGGTGSYTYTWNTSPVQNTQTATGLSAGTYFITVTDANGCARTDSVIVPSAGQVVLSTTQQNVLCNGGCTGSATVNASGSPPYGYAWNTMPAQNTQTATGLCAGTYTVTVTDNDNCSASISVTITEPSAITYTWSPSVCQGQSVTVGTNTYTMSGIYTDVLTASNGCDSTVTTDLTVYPAPSISFSGAPLGGCAPVCVTLTDNSTISSGNIVSRTWSIDGVAQSGNGPMLTHCFSQSGSYDMGLTATSNQGCMAQQTLVDYIVVQAPPIADFAYDPATISGFDSVIDFTSQSTDATQWFWTFGDGGVAFEEHPRHVYTGQARDYCVRLWVSNNYGCEDTKVKCIPVDPSLFIYFPNTFTPNRDGKNDQYGFHGSGRNILSFRFLVYDRWGGLLFETTDFTENWNGKIDNTGEEVSQGTYVYRADITTVDMKDHVFMGHINLVK